MEYNKDYNARTADEWFELGKWTGYLMTLPIGKTDGRVCYTVRDLLSLRATATMLTKKPECERAFDVNVDIEKKIVTVTPSLKKQCTTT
jgi:hypothetical protein